MIGHSFSLRELMTGYVSSNHGEMLLPGSSTGSCIVSFLIQPKTWTENGKALSGLGFPTSIDSLAYTCPQDKMIKQSLNWDSFLRILCNTLRLQENLTTAREKYMQPKEVFIEVSCLCSWSWDWLGLKVSIMRFCHIYCQFLQSSKYTYKRSSLVNV